ncbi:MAG: class I SAM-dependent methyltransferase [Rhizobiaceae bacterium]|nr:class I SAM-dependent methyltransferase [Rhizobiaceae bacterium]
MKCRSCGSSNLSLFVDLGSAPPSNAYLEEEALSGIEKWFPLRVFTCETCWLVQTEDFADFDELFSDEYAYFSSFSDSWLTHAERYVAECVDRFGLDANSNVVEIAANDGYLLQHVKERGVPCLGVEPTKSTAQAAREKGIEIVEEFFGRKLAQILVEQGKSADLMAANNVLAHVPDIVDFVAGFEILLKPEGVATFEFPHLQNLVQLNQFDTIYHEHFSYLSLIAVEAVCKQVGLKVFDVERLSTHGGSLRLFVQKEKTGAQEETQQYRDVLEEELSLGMNTSAFYQSFQRRTEKVKDDFLRFLLDAKEKGATVCGYGAAAKGNTLLNFAGVRPDLVSFIADRNPAKQGQYQPGSRIPIVSPDEIDKQKPDYVVIFPWNLSDEIMSQLKHIREWGGQFVTAVPELKVSK